MPLYLNNITIAGNLGKDAENRFTPNGTKITSFSIAHNRNFKVADKWETEVTWFNVKAFSLSDEMGTKLKAGSNVYVEGHVEMYTDTNSVKHANVVASIVKIIQVKAPDEANIV